MRINNIIGYMSEKKSSRATVLNKSIKDFVADTLYIPDENMMVIYHAEFYQNYLLLCMKYSIIVYDTKKKNIYREHQVRTNCASFIPNSKYIAFPSTGEEGRNCILNIWNYEKDSIDSKITFTFQIQTLKASHRCIILSSLTSLYVIHFPSLKPIFNNLAGNGFNIIYDMSKEGLTIVHNTQAKGQVCILNFTNKETKNLIGQIRTNKQLSQKIRRASSKRTIENNAFQNKQQSIQNEMHIKAHRQHVHILRLSPNGYRFVSGSTKGTVLRLYSSLNGQLIAEFHVCSALTNIVDINFIAEGNTVVCLNSENHVKLFHTKMSEEQLICQSIRKEKIVYEQQNPKSWLSFFGFLNEDLKYERAFSYFNLENLSSKKQIVKPNKAKVSHHVGMQQIKQQANQKQSHIVPEKGSNNSLHEEVIIEQLNWNQINPTISNNSENSSYRQSHTHSELQQKDSNYHKSNSKLPSRNSSHLKKKNHHTNSIKTLAKKQVEIINMSRQFDLNFRGAIMFQNHINIKVLKGKYYYQLKYDPFNGGEMMTKQNKINILDILTKQQK